MTSDMLAVIASGGKQYLVSEGEKVEVEKIEGEIGSAVFFEVLYAGDAQDAKIGTPSASDASVEGKILAQGHRDKVWGIKHKPKKRYKVKFGHRQPSTCVEITKISTK